jgi:lipopolysaccharide transport system permease protein/teichoic acid transport system permease protein
LAAPIYQLIDLTRALAVSNLRERYLGTWAGLVWAFVHPIIMIAIFWVVFTQGFRMPTGGDKPFLLILISALVPWFAFNDVVIGAAGSVVGKSYLVRKIAFPMEILPLTHAFGAFVVHVPLLVFSYAVILWYGFYPTRSLLLLPFYICSLFLLATAVGTLLAAIAVPFRDVLQGLTVILSLLFWATPIVWSADQMPHQFQWFVDYNPLSYIISGYRHAMLGPVSPAPSVTQATVFWLTTLVLVPFSIWVFRRLKSGFADML